MRDLSSNSRSLLLGMAKDSINAYLDGRNQSDSWPQDPELTQSVGCFVTLKKSGRLCGCIGTFDRSTPLCQNIARMAQSAAFHDIRFSPLKKSDMPSVSIEISVLGELRKIDDIREIELGKHGVLVKLGSRSGTLLPQVAVEQNWSREEFVMYCAREKAGFTPKECAAAEIFVYEVIKFSDAES